MACWGISEWDEDLNKLFVVNDAGLGEAIHAAAYFKEDVAVLYEVVELVFIHDFFNRAHTGIRMYSYRDMGVPR